MDHKDRWVKRKRRWALAALAWTAKADYLQRNNPGKPVVHGLPNFPTEEIDIDLQLEWHVGIALVAGRVDVFEKFPQTLEENQMGLAHHQGMRGPTWFRHYPWLEPL